MKAHILLSLTPQTEGTELEAACHVLIPNAVLFDLEGDSTAIRSTVLFCRVCVERALEQVVHYGSRRYFKYGVIEGQAAMDGRLAG